MSIKVGDYEVVIKKGDEELEALPSDLPVHDFEGNTVTLKEAQDGYMRQADYTRKTQSVADVRKFLVDELGFQDQSQGVATMRRIMDTLAELEQKGVLDPTTGEVKIPESKQQAINPNPDLEGDGHGGFVLGMENLPPDVKNLVEAHQSLQKDMGSLMGYISRKEIRENFPEVTEEEVEMVHKLAAFDPSQSPMEHMVSYDTKKKEWGQKAVDTYVEDLKKPKKEGHERDAQAAGDAGIEIFGEKPVFSFGGEVHPDGTNVVDPSKAANAYMEGVMKELEGE
ncbi:MAG: hypothetical protein ACXABD_21205 [Candidatus Thorarchaeota archaeon]|jgi:hypothetical protein